VGNLISLPSAETQETNPVTSEDFDEANQELKAALNKPFDVHGGRNREMIKSHQKKRARDELFRISVREAYSSVCAITRIGLRTETAIEVEAAHIIPVHREGPDDIRNGLTLCKTMHWAFDNGLISISEDHKLLVSKKFTSGKFASANDSLLNLKGKQILLPSKSSLQPAAEALQWHRKHWGYI
jgi:putative restriction endonuclease